MRVFFLTSIPPIPTWGTAMAFHRHFVEREGFEVFVATDNTQIRDFQVSYPFALFKEPAWLARLKRTRFASLAHSFSHLAAGRFVPRELVESARRFEPDLVLTVAGSWFWTAMLAQQLARHNLHVPFAASFNDWYDYRIIQHPRFRHRLERQFRKLYRHCDLALCTCEGMREALGSHHHAHILYPIGAGPAMPETELAPLPAQNRPFTVAFAGNLGDWYGRMLESLVTTARSAHAPIAFRFFGNEPSWSPEFDRWTRANGVFAGSLPFEALRDEIQSVDALLLPMGFDKACAQIEKTSFKTKFLDYLSFQKPILIWGPDYCSAVRTAREFDSAECCTVQDPAAFLAAIRRVADNSVRRTELLANARRMHKDRFHPERIHAAFLKACQAAVGGRTHGSSCCQPVSVGAPQTDN